MVLQPGLKIYIIYILLLYVLFPQGKDLLTRKCAGGAPCRSPAEGLPYINDIIANNWWRKFWVLNAFPPVLLTDSEFPGWYGTRHSIFIYNILISYLLMSYACNIAFPPVLWHISVYFLADMVLGILVHYSIDLSNIL